MHTTSQMLRTMHLDRSPIVVPPLLAKRAGVVTQGLSLLLEAGEYANALQRNVWDFAVELSALQAAGLTNSEIRCLICMGYVTHSREESETPANGTRRFCDEGMLTLGHHSCFVLTDEGARALQVLAPLAAPDSLFDGGEGLVCESQGGASAQGFQPFVPTWDCQRQELRLGGRLVKQFKLPSPNQEMVLSSFQEEGWPVRIDDPLPPVPDILPKRRLHDTIKSLNRSQKCRLIRFLGDGSGQGVRWELHWPVPTLEVAKS